MRGGTRRHHQEEEEESSFVSMTDMTVSFLFIIMILLAFFASQFNPEETVHRTYYDEALATIALQATFIEQKDELIDAQRQEMAELQHRIAELEGRLAELEQLLAEAQKVNPLETYIGQTARERRTILERLRDQLLEEFPDLNVVISAENDALRFQGDGLFASGSSALRDQQTVQVVQRIAGRLNEILPCYTLGRLSSWNDTCNPNGVVIEAVQIEGHTDAQGSDISNLGLSTDRANTTYAEMIGNRPDLVSHQNYRLQPVLSVAGYGEMRPIADNETVEGRSTNRRIDLRIIMFTPGSSEEIERIRSELQAGVRLVTP
ncbi:OmpA/MotB family protein [Devosia sp. A449]